MFKTILPLGVVIFFRFFGLFIVLPVLSIYLITMPNATPLLIGLAMSGYALTQLIFQAPFGYLSDKIGRKSVIVLGTLIFVAGSIVCYISQDIYMLIAGRLLQGAGAVAAVITALVSDLIKEEARSKAMALIGGSIAIGFTISMVAGPTISDIYGINSLFLISGILGILSLFIVIFSVPNPPQVIHHYNKKPDIKKILLNPSLITMNITNFLQKSVMTFTFVLVPIYLIGKFGWDKGELYMIYLPATILGVIAMGPASIIAEKKEKPKLPLIVGIVLFIGAYLFMASEIEYLFIIGIFLFFTGFNVHEPIMQSLASKLSKVHQKGISLGIFNTFGYLGTFTGGLTGAFLIKNSSLVNFSIVFAIIGILWLVLIVKMKNPAHSKNIYIPLDELKEKPTKNQMKKINGILEWYTNTTQKILIIKYDSTKTKEKDIKSQL
ncbi:Putative efflux protein [hydrothermal vent metagenome]|uniref:Efflux protein n=1 Tax=hydrothermal vent metagenome TaxID=652676 RepID=A0A3B1DR38_9ZZZZ